MKRPAFQFYVGDWRRNAKLRRCSHAGRGIWIDVLCLMHDSEEYGVLRWPLKDIAQAVGCKISELQALREKGVLKGGEISEQCEAYVYTPRHAGREGTPVTLVPVQPGPLWYSSRMVKDEYLRTNRGVGTRFGSTSGGEPNQREGTRQGAKPSHRHGDGASTASSTSTTGYSGGNTTTQAVDNSGKPDGEKEHGKNGAAVPRWWDTNEGIEAKGAELAFPAQPGELHGPYKARIFDELARRERAGA